MNLIKKRETQLKKEIRSLKREIERYKATLKREEYRRKVVVKQMEDAINTLIVENKELRQERNSFQRQLDDIADDAAGEDL